MELLWEEFGTAMPDAREVARVSLRLLFAAVVGGVIGFERERAGKAAGLRTHMLVSVGAAIVVIVPLQLRFDSDDLSRIIQGLVTGIGFIGGGAILKSRDKADVEGLTTAAGIWLTAGLGIAVGLGGIGIALLCATLALVILTTLFSFERLLKKNAPTKKP